MQSSLSDWLCGSPTFGVCHASPLRCLGVHESIEFRTFRKAVQWPLALFGRNPRVSNNTDHFHVLFRNSPATSGVETRLLCISRRYYPRSLSNVLKASSASFPTEGVSSLKNLLFVASRWGNRVHQAAGDHRPTLKLYRSYLFLTHHGTLAAGRTFG